MPEGCRTTVKYAELHCHSNYSFHEGASSLEELLMRAKELGYGALALTDHDNLSGAMEFARLANSLGIQPITGAEVTLSDGSHLTLLARDRTGYRNICRLLTFSRIKDRREPQLDPELLPQHAEGVILLTGCPKGRVPSLLSEGKWKEAETETRNYLDWFGPDNVFMELQQNLVQGDRLRCRKLYEMARKLGVGVVATNNVHYHAPERSRLQDALVAIRHNRTLEETHRERRPNANFHLKSHQEMASLFRETPEALENTLAIAERCSGFNLENNLGYQFPDHPVPKGHTPLSYLRELCYEAAMRRYGSISPRVRERLNEELRLIEKHELAGFFLIYYDIINMAREVMIDLGLVDRETPLEERPPGRGRGSSVSMLVGYLIGLSHIDPLQYSLSLDRFMNDEMGAVPDIDLDFPRNIREELILQVHRRWGWPSAALTGTIATYRMKGAIRDLGKALGLPPEDVDKLSKRVDTRHASGLRSEMLQLPEFRRKVEAPVWRDLIDLAGQLDGFPKYIGQHPGGMIISSTPLIDLTPVQPGAIDGRYVCQWDKDSVQDAGFVKIDFLSLGALSQMQEALEIIEERTGRYEDLSRIDFEDEAVYRSLHQADTIGIFQVESAAQMQTITRIMPTNLTEMAFEVAAVRPGVGVNDGVSRFIERYANNVPWEFDHPLEERALARTMGVILFQDQVNQLAMDVAGFSPKEADNLRRAFGRKNNGSLLQDYWEKFRAGAAARGVPEETALTIFKRFSGQYMFPESHAYAFGITAYQMAWMKHYYPLEFFVAIFNQQPMGFYNLETLKEDAKRHGVGVLNPDINESGGKCAIKDESVLMGFLNVKGVGEAGAEAILKARDAGGLFTRLGDAMERTGLQRRALESLVLAGAFDELIRGHQKADRRSALWEIGLRRPSHGYQWPLALPVDQDMADLPLMTDWEEMLEEYAVMEVHPRGHIMAYIRPNLDPETLPSDRVEALGDGEEVIVAGLVIRRQHPASSKTIFITLEDEFGHVPLVVWPDVFQRYRLVIREPALKVRGKISRLNGSMNVVVSSVEGIKAPYVLPKSRNWG